MTVKVDTVETGIAFIKSSTIPSENSRIYTSLDNPEKCSLEAMQEEIHQVASKVGPEGLLVLFFRGHGIYDPATKDWVLAPADYDCTLRSVLTTEMLTACIKQSKCKAKYVLLILDCCYSGAMASKMTGFSDKPFTILPNLYVITAGTSNESSITVASLKQSIFSYFFVHAFQQVEIVPGNFPLFQIFQECQLCSEALSSLVVFVDDKFHLIPGIAKPAMHHFNPQTAPLEEVDGSIEYPGRVTFATKYLTPSAGSNLKVDDRALNWLDKLVKESPYPLQVLNEKGLFQHSGDKASLVLKAAISLMTLSVAMLELEYNRSVLEDANHFLIAFIEIVSRIDKVNFEVLLTPHLILESCSFYNAVLLKKGVDNTSIRELYKRMHNDILGEKQVRNFETDCVRFINCYGKKPHLCKPGNY